jgi:DNA-binding NtrC family response regulator
VNLFVLLVDDEALVRIVIEFALHDLGCRVMSLETGGAGEDAIRNSPGDFDALVLNVDLGGGRSGFDLARTARRIRPDIPVVHVTGGGGHNFENEKVDGAVLLQKPFTSVALGHALEQAMANMRARSLRRA